MLRLILAVKNAFRARKPGTSGSEASGKSELRQNAEKALAMKQAAGPQTHIPDHRTSHTGGVAGGQVGYSDTAVGKEPTYASNLKRSHNARVGDGR
jgi:hypothetical protein